MDQLEQPGADILSFPQSPQDRLRVALRRMEAALAEQTTALAGLRASMGELGTAVSGLQGGLRDYQRSLATVSGDTLRAHQAALKLETTAELMLGR